MKNSNFDLERLRDSAHTNTYTQAKNKREYATKISTKQKEI